MRHIVLVIAWACVCVAQAQRHFTVRDSIEMLTFSRDQVTEEQQGAYFSPDRKYSFTVARRGLLESNQIEGRITLFDTAGVKRALSQRSPQLQPRELLAMATSSNSEAISEARWSADGNSILFLGRNKDAERHLFRLEIATGRLEQLSPEGQDVTEFDCVGDKCVFTARPSVAESELYQSGGPSLPDIQIGTGTSLISLLYPSWEPFAFGTSSQHVWRVQNGNASPVITSTASHSVILFRGAVLSHLALSPSGRYAVGINKVDSVPATWERYEPAFSFAKFTRTRAGSQPATDLSPAQYVLIDLSTGESAPLTEAPVGWSAAYFADVFTAKWSADEREVAASNTFVPIGNSAGSHVANSPLRPCVAVIHVDTRQAECVLQTGKLRPGEARNVLRDINWRMSDHVLELQYTVISGSNRSQVTHSFFNRNGSWIAAGKWRPENDDNGGSADQDLTIVVRQDVNTPPVLMGSDSRTGGLKKLWDPNPQLNGIDLGVAEIYNWRDKAGHRWSGGLIKPPGFVAGHRYPLVLQTHGFYPDRFLSDGVYSTANAARAMAAHGIIVLQVGEPVIAPPYTPAEAETNGRFGYVSAIEQLGNDGLVNPHKVGIIGFSHTGSFVLNTLIHSPQYFVAATLAESSYNSFGQYLGNADYRGHEEASAIARSVGSEPFGKGLKTWLAASPGFNTDRINVPILFEENEPVSLVDGWDLYAALRLQSKPVELLYMRNGEHVLTRPLQVLASQSLTVDWYDFWLNDHEDPAPLKAEQYRRWRGLRDLQRRVATTQ
jgi:hypothetical protein